MPKYVNRRVRKQDMEEMLTAAIPLAQLADYAPFDPSLGKDQIVQAVAKVNATRQQEKLAADAYSDARDAAIAAEHECYRIILAARRHCLVQYGENSGVVHALGFKRRAEYKRSSRTTPTDTSQAG